ncbi:MAG: NTP transferase domain-containing protein [Dorea sp.]|jgi:2-C-methyl-D-erythritol 4-phosphate cytidylyltransferase|nr:NTP transferase domain-containing protein [Dorea sp.]MCI9247756.1 NTP transferase domain-containing protein [Dorea sp.]
MNGAIILAGGQGSRFKKKKQFELLYDKEMWKYVYEKALNVVERKNIVVVGVDIAGGDTRSKSVYNGLMAMPETCDRVIILEAARPLVTENQIKKLLSDKNKSTTFALPLVNTVIGRDGSYYDRNDFYDLLTPQAFDFKLLKEAYKTGKYEDTTDETIIMSQEYGIKPAFILEGENLLKVTYERDMEIVSNLLKQQEGAGQ